MVKVGDALGGGNFFSEPGTYQVEIVRELTATTAKTGTRQAELKLQELDGDRVITDFLNSAGMFRVVRLACAVAKKLPKDTDEVDWDLETCEDGERVTVTINDTGMNLEGRQLDITLVPNPRTPEYMRVAAGGFARLNSTENTEEAEAL